MKLLLAEMGWNEEARNLLNYRWPHTDHPENWIKMESRKAVPNHAQQLTFKSESEGTKQEARTTPEAADCISTPFRNGPLDVTLVKVV